VPEPSFPSPPTGRAFILKFDQGNPDYPIIGVAFDPNAGQGLNPPAIGSAITFDPLKLYTGWVFVDLDVTSFDKRVVWTYRNLPGPQLIGQSQTSEGLEATITTQDFLANEAPSEGFLTLQSESSPTDSPLQTVKNVTVAYYPDQPGQEYDKRLNVVFPFTQKTVEYGVDSGNPATDLAPKDSLRVTEREYDLAAIQAALEGVHRSYPGMTGLNIPPVLLGITVVPVNSFSTGVAAGTGAGNGSGADNWSYNVETRNSSEAGASYMYELIPVIDYAPAENRIVQDYFLFLAGPSLSMAALLSALEVQAGSVVNPWPVWYPKEAPVYVQGQRVSVKAAANGNASASAFANDTSSGSSTAYAKGTESSSQFEDSIRVYTIPPTLHGVISNDTTQTVSATASASIDITGTVAVSVPVFEVTESAIATADFTLAATVPPAWPDTGLYLQGIECESYDYETIMIRARIFDFSTLIPA
jgi:hypothetical protein